MQDLGRHLNLKEWMKSKTKKLKKLKNLKSETIKKQDWKMKLKKLKKKHWTLKLKIIKKKTENWN
jgi:hypothetical protein